MYVCECIYTHKYTYRYEITEPEEEQQISSPGDFEADFFKVIRAHFQAH